MEKQLTAVEWFLNELLESKIIATDNYDVYMFRKAKEMEKEQKIKMLNTFLCNAQMGEDVEDVEGWFENYEKQKEQVKKELTSEEIPESFFKPVLGEPIWNVTNRITKQQEQ
jgi:predicted methyltransferase